MTNSEHFRVNSDTLMPQADMYCRWKAGMGPRTHHLV